MNGLRAGRWKCIAAPEHGVTAVDIWDEVGEGILLGMGMTFIFIMTTLVSLTIEIVHQVDLL